MTVAQIYNLVNTATLEALGKSDIVQEDLSNVVDVGNAVFNADAVDNYVKSLLNHIGKVIFVDRKYSGAVPSVLMDSWAFGSVLEKVQADTPDATENESWELEDGASYDPNIFYQPKVSATFFNKRVTFEVPMSFTERQVKESFSNAEQLNSFLSMIENAVDRAMTIKIDSLVMRTINNAIAETIHSDYGADGLGTKSGVKAVNLLKLYNDKNGTTITPVQALTNPEFIRFASYTIGMYQSKLSRISSLFNIDGKDRFTPSDLQHVVLLNDFAKAAGVYLYDSNGQFNTGNIKLPQAEVVPFWQSSGKTYDFADTSHINVKTGSGDVVDASGILGIIYDRDALGVTNYDRRVTTNYNPKAEFYSNWYKFDCGSFNSLSENVVVFFVAAAS